MTLGPPGDLRSNRTNPKDPAMTLALIEHAAVGAPLTRAGLSLFPVFLHQHTTPDVGPRGPGIEIGEQDHAEVASLVVTNTGARAVLLTEGEIVTGGLQHRTLNVTVIVASGDRLDVPVSCVEAGRWNGGGAFDSSRTFASRRVRRVKHATVERSVRHHDNKHSDQGRMWSAIGSELSRLGAENDTAALVGADAVLERDDRLNKGLAELIRLGPLPGQCGVVAAHGSRVVAAELFASRELLAANWEPLVRSYLLDVPTQVHGSPSATRALRFLRRFASGPSTDTTGVGLGHEHHVRTKRLVGQAVTLQGALIHASAFALAA
jgi:hypothetical protein